MIRLTHIAVSLLALAVGLEGATRLDEWVRWGTPVASTARSLDDIITIDSTGARGIPHAQYRQFALNSLGLRGPEPRAGRPRILVFGASETFGLYESPGREYVRQVEDSLAARGCAVDVLNASLPGFSLPTLLAGFGHSVAARGASVAIIYPTPVQYLQAARPAFVPPVPAGARAADGLAGLRAARRLRDHAKSVVPDWLKTVLRQLEIKEQRRQLAGGPLWTTVPDERLSAFIDDLGALVDSLEGRGITPVLATHANAFPPGVPRDRTRLVAWAKFYPRADPALLPVFDSVANLRIRELAVRRGLTIADPAVAFAAPDPDPEFADFSHFTDQGAARMAGVLMPAVLSRLPCAR
jgi:hypothetical protein